MHCEGTKWEQEHSQQAKNYTYYCSCSNVGSCIIVPSLPHPRFHTASSETWGCESLGMWLECTQDRIRNTMMQHAGCIPIELIVQVCNGTSAFEHSVSMLNIINTQIQYGLSDGMLMKQST